MFDGYYNVKLGEPGSSEHHWALRRRVQCTPLGTLGEPGMPVTTLTHTWEVETAGRGVLQWVIGHGWLWGGEQATLTTWGCRVH